VKHPCVTFWPEKFFADTGHLSGEAAGIYMVLLMQAWTRGGSLPNDQDHIRLLARISRQRWQEYRKDIMALWFLGEDGRWHQKRLDKEWARAEKRRPDEQKSLDNLPLRVSGKNAKNADTLGGQKPNKNNGATPPSRAGARPLPLPQNSLPPGRESSEGKAQSNSQPPAPRRVLKAHAPRAAPDTSGPGYTLLYPDGVYPPEVLPPKNRA
jgi:uncharacterized protein YdaU (DUF1376 family)